MYYSSTKTYGHEVGLSTAFRQYKADSHCSKLHGYALSVKIEFEANILDRKNWVVDFGGLKSLKKELENTFDHKTVVAADDPQLEFFKEGEKLGVLDLVILPNVGCEFFSYYIFNIAEGWLHINEYSPRCKVRSVEVREHGANSATYQR